MKVPTNNQIFMKEALDIAWQAYEIGEVPIGAVIVKDGQIIGSGYNLRELSQDSTNHAEIIAIQEACAHINSWRLEDCTMYVTIEPCLMCSGAILNARIPVLYYGAKNPKAGVVDSLYHTLTDDRFNHQVEVHSGLGQQSAAFLMKSFFKRARKKRKILKNKAKFNK